MSGQQINFSKSFIQFGNTVEDAVQIEIKQLLEISTIGVMGSYLAIPESMGVAKTKKNSILFEKDFKIELMDGPQNI